MTRPKLAAAAALATGGGLLAIWLGLGWAERDRPGALDGTGVDRHASRAELGEPGSARDAEAGSSGAAPEGARGSTAGPGSSGAPARSTSPTDQPLGRSPFATRLERAMREDTKSAYRDLLKDWRSGRLTVDQERAIDGLLGARTSAEVDKAAGQVLLDDGSLPAQHESLAALLAASGSEDAVGYLLAACADPGRQPAATSALATLADPNALPSLARGLRPEDPPAVLEAALVALRNMDTEKARALEAEVRAWLEGR